MADANIKKIVIPKAQLPSIIDAYALSSGAIARGEKFAYNIRYRVVSEDRNRTSYWSRIYNINATGQTGSLLSYSYVKETVNAPTVLDPSATNVTLRVNWTIPETLKTNTFDIFVKKNSGSYAYYGTSYTNTYVINRSPSLETSITILVQTPTYPKAITTSAKLFETVAITVP